MLADPVMQAMFDTCVPGLIVVALYRSFLAPYLVHPRLPSRLRGLLTCPLCLGFHVAWIWLWLRGHVPDPTLSGFVNWFGYVITAAVLSYTFEAMLSVVAEATATLAWLRTTSPMQATHTWNADDAIESSEATTAAVEGDEDVVERNRRG